VVEPRQIKRRREILDPTVAVQFTSVYLKRLETSCKATSVNMSSHGNRETFNSGNVPNLATSRIELKLVLVAALHPMEKYVVFLCFSCDLNMWKPQPMVSPQVETC
jgi:hypothetical protein